MLLMFLALGFIAGCNEQGNQPESTWGTMVWDESEWQ
ncbi:hypothetical protein MED297_11530 [Reinekea sp. MED297]|uniref:Uncharacterized protein n=1 Tax=Reinekea blandensis MED297 TaxID=314283 RepID=A4BB31_9GAMM|nr:hypothetical protein MED297_11530 [Reinekea sp. MED297] [Reinekea blandensis MED297]